jgi:hypothetical protein
VVIILERPVVAGVVVVPDCPEVDGVVVPDGLVVDGVVVVPDCPEGVVVVDVLVGVATPKIVAVTA